jgi:hypothetical protein
MQKTCLCGYPFGMGTRTVGWIVGIIALTALALIGYAVYAGAQKKAQQRQVIAIVEDTTGKLRQALAEKSSAELVDALDANLKAARAPRDPQLSNAAEHYILSAREIARRRSDSNQLWARAESSRRSLAGHMARAERRSEPWLRVAVSLKKRVEDDYFQLGLTLKGLDEILYKLPEEQKPFASRYGNDILLPRDEIDRARKQAQADLTRAEGELAGVRRIGP